MRAELAGVKRSAHNHHLIARQKHLVVTFATEVDEAGKQGVSSVPFLLLGENTQTAKVKILKKRSEFLFAAKGTFFRTRGFLLQAKKRIGAEEMPFTRVGFTCSKKVGNAVARNRAKRRLREVARLLLADYGRPGWDYVLIGKANKTVELSFADLCHDFKTCLSKFHQEVGAK